MSSQAQADPPFRPAHAVHAVGRQKLLGHLAMLVFALLTAGSYSIGAMAAPLIEPGALNGIRFLVAVPILGAMAMFALGGRIPAPVAVWRYVVLGGLMATFFITMFVSLRHTGPVSAGAVFTLMPIMGAAFGYMILGQVPHPVMVGSLLIAALGALWVIFDGSIEALLAFDIGYGEAIFLIGVAGHALYSPLVRRLNRGEPVVAFAFWTMLATGVWICLYGARDIVATDWGALPSIVWIAILYLVVFTTSITFFLMQFASMRLPASKVLAYTYLTPTFVIVLEGVIGHGWAPPAVATGALVTVLGLVVLAASRDA